jgi:hypothetical protein
MRNWAIGVSILMMVSQSHAETVEVKSMGAVDLATYECRDTSSSFVHRICYDKDEAMIVVLLRATFYAYCRVDVDTYSAWLNADSKGRYYNQSIKSSAVGGRYSCN